MKILRGYLTAAIFAAITWVLMQFGERFTTLVDMVYPYVIRTLQGYLAAWSGGVDFLLWQVLAVALGAGILASLVVVIVLRWNVISWAGWVLSVFAGIYMLHTAMFGLSYYAGPIAEDIRMTTSKYTVGELAEATEYYRDRAMILAELVDRDQQGNVQFSEFEVLAEQAGQGFETLTYDRSYPIFAGSREPVKKLGWADMYTSMGITGFTFGITGEAAVNPQIPDVTLPFTIAHEMAHRMCIAVEKDANFAAYLACSAHESIEFQYSAYYMAYRYCYNSLASANSTSAAAAAARISTGVSDLLRRDLQYYDDFFFRNRDDRATQVADTVNDTYLKTSGDNAGIRSYGQVTDLLVNWHIKQVVIPELTITVTPFDPYDETQVFPEPESNPVSEGGLG